MNDKLRLATRSDHESLLAITTDLIASKAEDAKRNHRGREIHVLHRGDSDTLQRMLNALQPGSYVRPHRHLDPPKDEGVVLLAGALGFVVFDENGRPDRRRCLRLDSSSGIVGVDFRAGLWHTFLALEPDTVVYEIKSGPYDASIDKEFAPWAPPEDAPEAGAYLKQLEQLFL